MYFVKKFKPFILIVLLCAPFAAAEDPGPRSVYRFPLDHPVYGELRDLLRSAGQPLYSWSPPFDANEIATFLEPLDPEALDPAERALYERIHSRLGGRQEGRDEGLDAGQDRALFEEGLFAFDLAPSLSLEGRFRSDDTIPWRGRARDETPLLALPMDFLWAGRFHAALDLDIRNAPAPWANAEGPVDSNIPWPPTEVDLSVPYRAFLSAGGSWWTFALGRDLLDYGAGKSGNLAISANPDYYDFARVSFFSKSLRLSGLVSQLPLFMDFLNVADIYDENNSGIDLNKKVSNRYLYYSRLDLRLFSRLGLSIGQGIIVGDAPLDLRFINPFLIYHSQWPWNNYPQESITPDTGDSFTSSLVGSLFTLDLDLALPAGFAAYALYAMNEFTTGTERGIYGNNSTPDSIVILLGLEWVALLDAGRLSIAFEGLWGSPYLYLLSSPYASFVWMNRNSALYHPDCQTAWLGHPYARDSLYFALDVRFEEPRRSWGAVASWQLKGEHADLVYDYVKTVEAASLLAPSGVVEHNLSLKLMLEWTLLSYLSLGGSVDLYGIVNRGHVVAATACGVQAALHISWKPLSR